MPQCERMCVKTDWQNPHYGERCYAGRCCAVSDSLVVTGYGAVSGMATGQIVAATGAYGSLSKNMLP